MSLSLTSWLTTKTLIKALILVILMAFATITVLPSYWSGQWPWMTPPGVAQIQSLRTLKTTGLSLPGWQSDYQEIVSFGGNQWSVQQFTPEQASEKASAHDQGDFLLLLKPQTEPKNQPEVEWLDLKGAQQWTTDSRRQLRLRATTSTADTLDFDVQANFLRVWNQQQTYAALQWYAWPGAGHPAPGHWFWGDQKAQWQAHQRLPWVAVSLLVPIEPLGNIIGYQEYIEHLGDKVQTALQVQVFKSSSSRSP
jgi:cyanoexosortase B-associated protein